MKGQHIRRNLRLSELLDGLSFFSADDNGLVETPFKIAEHMVKLALAAANVADA